MVKLESHVAAFVPPSLSPQCITTVVAAFPLLVRATCKSAEDVVRLAVD